MTRKRIVCCKVHEATGYNADHQLVLFVIFHIKFQEFLIHIILNVSFLLKNISNYEFYSPFYLNNMKFTDFKTVLN